MSNEDAINILSGNWGTAFTADDVPEIRRKAAAEARAALLAEVLAVVDAFAAEGTTVPVMIALGGLRARLAALNNQTEKQDV